MQNDTTNAAAIDARCAEYSRYGFNQATAYYLPVGYETAASFKRMLERTARMWADKIIALRTQQAEAPTGRWQVCYRALPFGDCFRQTYWFFVDGTKVDAEREFERMNATARAYELRWIIEAEAVTLAQGVQS